MNLRPFRRQRDDAPRPAPVVHVGCDEDILLFGRGDIMRAVTADSTSGVKIDQRQKRGLRTTYEQRH
ncbi:hypothetical protein [Kineosporia succinea]|uniref:Uncharacterized protein n=1 Tax=Kineosporia succinea TaxID=84632 RepID=A0ABT9P7U5_9ACTN|nr:hypothetical protein [Kineosporia succinea]MDP9828772.1 hypothetical protein [Kineosporia succinea]